MSWTCEVCRLPDPHHGDGNGETTCACDRCFYCGTQPGGCDCEDDGSAGDRTTQADWLMEAS